MPKGELLLPEHLVSNRRSGKTAATAWLDKTITYAEGNEQVTFTPKDILKSAARMLRDGKSLAYIANELDVKGIVSYRELERAIRNVGMPLLERDIALGMETEESRIQIDTDLLPIRSDEQDE